MEFSIVYLYSALIVAGALINLIAWRHELSGGKAMETVLFWCLVIGVGLTGITVFSSLLLFPGTPLDPSGWPGGGAFRWESGPAWLAIGLAGLASAKWRGGFWGATILIASVVFLGNFAGQLTNALGNSNAGAILSGPVFWFELALPMVMILLWVGVWIFRRNRDVWLQPLQRKPS